MTILRFKNFKIDVYKPGKSSVKKLSKIVKLSANESALGASPRAKKLYQIRIWIFQDIQMENQTN